TQPWNILAPKDCVDLVASLTLAPIERLGVARFAFFRERVAVGEAALHAALEGNAQLKTLVDELLRTQRNEPLPPGGYGWHRERFLPAAEVNRRRQLEDVAQRVEKALGSSGPVTLEPVVAAPAHELDAFAPALATATELIVAELRRLYEPPRDWIASYRK